jgi:serpin B
MQAGLKLYRALPSGGNVAFSPYSVLAALAMVYTGARGETRRELEEVLGLDEPLPDVPIDVANAIWAQEELPLEPAFVEAVDAGLQTTDFTAASATDDINRWVADRTHGLIERLLDELPLDTQVVLVNALYLKARWQTAFDEVWDLPFSLASGESVTVPFVVGERHLGYACGDGFEAVELPYEDGRLAMVMAFCDDPSAALAADFRPETIDLRFPRFELRSSHKLIPPLAALGVRRLFDRDCDLTGMADVMPPLFVDDVLQKVFVRTDALGTEAAAATGVVARRSAAPARPPRVVAFDRPFFFAVRDRPTGALLFVGRVADPS